MFHYSLHQISYSSQEVDDALVILLQHTKDFPLYTEAIKFFNHPESMVRIAVRTLTLNVYRVQDASMLRFIRDSLEKALESTSDYDRDYATPEYSGSKSAFGFEADKDTDQSSCDLDPELVSNSIPSTSHISGASSVVHDSTEDLVTQIHSVPSNSLNENLPDSPLPDSGIESNASSKAPDMNITDEEKQKLKLGTTTSATSDQSVPIEKILEREEEEIGKRPFLKTILDSLNCKENDYKALFALCLLFALINNKVGKNLESNKMFMINDDLE
ncbi:Protein CLEC16A homolog [Eumeta japonica]|uniref:Protein CLEC16A homolog n=1 Tax=Eumeta variegata TaxID=151549 RepID=A0A4C1ZSJ5_EUMVA|nr:Protein CLEC16A homolog [Eumeta japonica]